jgi:hypothetical protein
MAALRQSVGLAADCERPFLFARVRGASVALTGRLPSIILKV